MSLNTVQWGIIGCGDVTEVKSGPGFQKAENSDLVAVMRRSGDKAADYAKRHNVPNWYDDADDLINDPDVNAVYVATPPGSHKEYAIKAIEAGKPVYVEKPMALNYAECEEILTAGKKANVPVFTAFYRRRLPSFEKVKELVESGAIGEVRFINMELYWPPRDGDKSEEKHWHVLPEISGGGHFFDLAPHQLDYLDYVFGPIAGV
ncbi:MAG: gfo/Idh/MocA family oxidoreductase, partial [Candidatus Marinimicrobia bacterium]|nr:gfo/Idh/MocA family oxidoreductase [Candidatus Neomarinimicrobiota bacterium]